MSGNDEDEKTEEKLFFPTLPFQINDEVRLVAMEDKNCNDKIGVIKDYFPEKGCYEILVYEDQSIKLIEPMHCIRYRNLEEFFALRSMLDWTDADMEFSLLAVSQDEIERYGDENFEHIKKSLNFRIKKAKFEKTSVKLKCMLAQIYRKKSSDNKNFALEVKNLMESCLEHHFGNLHVITDLYLWSLKNLNELNETKIFHLWEKVDEVIYGSKYDMDAQPHYSICVSEVLHTLTAFYLEQNSISNEFKILFFELSNYLAEMLKREPHREDELLQETVFSGAIYLLISDENVRSALDCINIYQSHKCVKVGSKGNNFEILHIKLICNIKLGDKKNAKKILKYIKKRWPKKLTNSPIQDQIKKMKHIYDVQVPAKLEHNEHPEVIKCIEKCSNLSCDKIEKFSRQFKACARCRLATYCSKECQNTHWKIHKTECFKSN